MVNKNVARLPFDIRAYRTIFHENSIGEKNGVEEALRRDLFNIASHGRPYARLIVIGRVTVGTITKSSHRRPFRPRLHVDLGFASL